MPINMSHRGEGSGRRLAARGSKLGKSRKLFDKIELEPCGVSESVDLAQPADQTVRTRTNGKPCEGGPQLRTCVVSDVTADRSINTDRELISISKIITLRASYCCFNAARSPSLPIAKSLAASSNGGEVRKIARTETRT
jgi:hypothetical protein